MKNKAKLNTGKIDIHSKYTKETEQIQRIKSKNDINCYVGQHEQLVMPACMFYRKNERAENVIIPDNSEQNYIN